MSKPIFSCSVPGRAGIKKNRTQRRYLPKQGRYVTMPYVSASRREIGGDGFLRGAYGNGVSPSEAVEDDWRQLVDFLPSDRYIAITDPYGKQKKYVWNGFMWAEFPYKNKERGIYA